MITYILTWLGRGPIPEKEAMFNAVLISHSA
jgi:hypothetical protein